MLVLSPVGSTINGSHSWIQLPGGFSVQPSEIAKVALCVGLAVILAERRERGGPADQPRPAPRGRGRRRARSASSCSSRTSARPWCSERWRSAWSAVSGAPRRWVAGAVALVVAGDRRGADDAGALAVPAGPVDRLPDPSADPEGIGYQTRQVRVAIGSGGLGGQGLFQGRQTQGGFIPFQQTDFVFSVAGEELGLVGAAGVVVLLGFLILRSSVVALRRRTRSAGWWPSASPAGSSSRCSRTSG